MDFPPQGSCRGYPCYHAACADNTAVSDGNSACNGNICGYPAVVSYSYGLAVFKVVKLAVFAHIGYKLSDYLGTLLFLVLKGVIKHFAQLVSLYSQVGKLLVRWVIELSCQHFFLFGHMLLLLRLCVLLLYSFKRTGNFFDDLSVNALLSLTDSVVKCLSVGASVCLDNRL